MDPHQLQRLCDDVLIQGMSEPLKDAIDAALARGGTLEGVLEAVERGGAAKNSMVWLAAWAYAERKLKGADDGEA